MYACLKKQQAISLEITCFKVNLTTFRFFLSQIYKTVFFCIHVNSNVDSIFVVFKLYFNPFRGS